MSIVSPERVNASLLLDHNLEAGRGDKPALLGEFGTLTFADVARLTARTASLLRELGVGREHRVLMVLDDSPAFHAIFLGAIRLGAVPIPINPMDRADNYAYYLDDSYAKVLGRRGGAARQGGARAGRAPRSARARGQRRPARPLELRRRRGGASRRADRAGRHPSGRHGVLAVQLGLDRPAEGRRAHAARHRRDDRHLRAPRAARSRADDLCYSTTKLFHAYGLGNGLSFPLSAGATAVQVHGPVAAGPHPRDRRAPLRPTLFFSVPALYAAMLKTPALAETDFSERPRLHLGRRAAPRRRLGALAGADRRADPRRHRVDRDAAHLLLQHARGPAARARPGTPVPGYELRVVDERGRTSRPDEAGRPARARRELRRLLLAPAREDAPLHARRVVLHRRPLRQDGRRALRLPGPRRRHDQGRRPVGRARRRRGVPRPPSRASRRRRSSASRSRTSAASRRS